MDYFIGIDVGASTTKAVIIDEKKNVLSYSVTDSGADFEAAAEKVFHDCQEKANVDLSTSPCPIVSTGYGRRNVHFASTPKTEISCHAMGSY